jgi:hypothetical protein
MMDFARSPPCLESRHATPDARLYQRLKRKNLQIASPARRCATRRRSLRYVRGRLRYHTACGARRRAIAAATSIIHPRRHAAIVTYGSTAPASPPKEKRATPGRSHALVNRQREALHFGSSGDQGDHFPRPRIMPRGSG